MMIVLVVLLIVLVVVIVMVVVNGGGGGCGRCNGRCGTDGNSWCGKQQLPPITSVAKSP